MKVLIADDDAVSRRLLRMILEGVPGTEVTEAPDGLAAWTLLHSGFKPDVCFLDHLMPGLNGIDLLERIRSELHLLDLPVVMCTACNVRDIVMQAVNLRVKQYIIKPYKAEAVLKRYAEIRKEFDARQPLHHSEEACAALGISSAEYQERLGTLVAHLSRSISAIAVAIGNGDLLEAAARLPELRQACLGVKASAITNTIAELEASLVACDLSSWKPIWPPPPGRIEKLPRIMSRLEALRREAGRLEQAARDQGLVGEVRSGLSIAPESSPTGSVEVSATASAAAAVAPPS